MGTNIYNTKEIMWLVSSHLGFKHGVTGVISAYASVNIAVVSIGCSSGSRNLVGLVHCDSANSIDPDMN